jgi:hypothetical protein
LSSFLRTVYLLFKMIMFFYNYLNSSHINFFKDDAEVLMQAVEKASCTVGVQDLDPCDPYVFVFWTSGIRIFNLFVRNATSIRICTFD